MSPVHHVGVVSKKGECVENVGPTVLLLHCIAIGLTSPVHHVLENYYTKKIIVSICILIHQKFSVLITSRLFYRKVKNDVRRQQPEVNIQLTCIVSNFLGFFL